MPAAALCCSQNPKHIQTHTQTYIGDLPYNNIGRAGKAVEYAVVHRDLQSVVWSCARCLL